LLDANSARQETPLPIDISREDLYRRMSDGDRPTLVEALGVGYYAAMLLPDRHAQIVVYCTDTGASSDAVATRLEELGYAAVAVYRDGKEDWVEHGLPLERLDTDE
jgi:rhodanese-related sulfurtransferase